MPEPGQDVRVLLPAGSPAGSASLDELVSHYAYPRTVTGGRCWVRANMVASLDGAAAGADGRSAPLSSPADRRLFHLMRGLADVVLVGAGTARTEGYGPVAEHPDLASGRRAEGRRPAAVLVQVSRSGRAQAGKQMFDRPGDALVVVPSDDEAALATATRIAGEGGVLPVASAPGGGPDLAAVLVALAERGLTRVLCEGGPSLLGDLVEADLLDELCLTTSPVLGGGAELGLLGDGVPSTRPMRLAGLAEAGSTLFGRWVRDR